MKGMRGLYDPNNNYPCFYCQNYPWNDPDNVYNAYRGYPYPYNYNPQDYDQGFSTQYYPYTYNMEDDWNTEEWRYSDNGNYIELRDYGPNPFVININEATKQNDNFRTALWTGKHLQLTLMSIGIGEDIGLEIHPHLDQFIRIEEGQGIVKMGNKKDKLDFQANVSDDFAFIIPAGTWHNLINTGDKPIKLYSIYAPPQHPFGTVHETKADAEAAE